MTQANPIVFSPSKVSVDRQRVQAYLKGERIWPMTMELDLTQKCTRSCPSCPYGVARQPGYTLTLPFLDRLFGILGPNTPGLVLSGGESTSVPHFPQTIQLARQHGFKEIAVITNGTELGKPEVQEALLSGASSVRVSLYDWQDGETESFHGTLRRIEHLRKRADREGSRLEIAAAMLTHADRTEHFAKIGSLALDAGIHWLYFHPFCEGWEGSFPRQASQEGVIEALDAFKEIHPEPDRIQVPYGRYTQESLEFEVLHGAYFLIQVGADGVNYAGPECKYDEDYALLDLNHYLKEDFLWHPERISKIRGINSSNYKPIGTKHRPPVFSDFLQKCIDRGIAWSEAEPHEPSAFHQPNII